MAVCVGCGLEIVDGALQVDVDGVTIGCGASGLYAVGNNITKSPDACNGLQIRANGLWAACPDAIVGITPSTAADPGTDMFGPDGDYNWDSGLTTFTNNSCTTYMGLAFFQTSTLGWVKANNIIRGHHYLNTDGAGFGEVSPLGGYVAHNLHATSNMEWGFSMQDIVFVNVAPGQTKTYQHRLKLHMQSGNGVGPHGRTSPVSGAVAFETQWLLVPTGYCTEV